MDCHLNRYLVLGTFAALTAATGALTDSQFFIARAEAGAKWTSPSISTSTSIESSVDFEQRLNAEIPTSLVFTDAYGSTAPLQSFLQNRPSVFVLAYSRCANMCSMVLNSLVENLQHLTLTAGAEYNVVVLSIDPTETAGESLDKQKTFMQRYAHPGTEGGFHFLHGTEENIRTVAAAVGFRYAYDAKTKEYAHASGIMILTPNGHVSKYFMGLAYPPQDLKFALMEATQGKIGTLSDRILLMCHKYDPRTGRYGLIIMRSFKVVGVLTIVLLGLGLLLLMRRDPSRGPRPPSEEYAKNKGAA